MKVRDIMETDIAIVRDHATYREVAELLHRQNRGCAFVVDAHGAIVGLVSEFDLFRILFPFYGSYYLHPELYTDREMREGKIDEIQHHPVRSFMTTQIFSIEPDAPGMRAGALMLAKNARRLPVVEHGKLIGVISRRHLYHELLRRHFSSEKGGEVRV